MKHFNNLLKELETIPGHPFHVEEAIGLVDGFVLVNNPQWAQDKLFVESRKITFLSCNPGFLLRTSPCYIDIASDEEVNWHTYQLYKFLHENGISLEKHKRALQQADFGSFNLSAEIQEEISRQMLDYCTDFIWWNGHESLKEFARILPLLTNKEILRIVAGAPDIETDFQTQCNFKRDLEEGFPHLLKNKQVKNLLNLALTSKTNKHEYFLTCQSKPCLVYEMVLSHQFFAEKRDMHEENINRWLIRLQGILSQHYGVTHLSHKTDKSQAKEFSLNIYAPEEIPVDEVKNIMIDCFSQIDIASHAHNEHIEKYIAQMQLNKKLAHQAGQSKKMKL